jgi:hypothetical protein
LPEVERIGDKRFALNGLPRFSTLRCFQNTTLAADCGFWGKAL